MAFALAARGDFDRPLNPPGMKSPMLPDYSRQRPWMKPRNAGPVILSNSIKPTNIESSENAFWGAGRPAKGKEAIRRCENWTPLVFSDLRRTVGLAYANM
jgi:hypothetical protein